MQTDERARTLPALMELNERRCGTIKEATALMHDLMKAVRDTGKSGEVVLKFKVSVDKNDELALNIEQKVTASIPKADPKKALIYHDVENRAFTKTDPRQLELLAEQEAERQERLAELQERGISQIGRGVAATA